MNEKTLHASTTTDNFFAPASQAAAAELAAVGEAAMTAEAAATAAMLQISVTRGRIVGFEKQANKIIFLLSNFDFQALKTWRDDIGPKDK